MLFGLVGLAALGMMMTSKRARIVGGDYGKDVFK
jgi:hypothetical protein